MSASVHESPDDSEIAHLRLLSSRGHDEELGRGMRDLDFSDDGRCVRRHEKLAQVVDNKLIPT